MFKGIIKNTHNFIKNNKIYLVFCCNFSKMTCILKRREYCFAGWWGGAGIPEPLLGTGMGLCFSFSSHQGSGGLQGMIRDSGSGTGEGENHPCPVAMPSSEGLSTKYFLAYYKYESCSLINQFQFLPVIRYQSVF